MKPLLFYHANKAKSILFLQILATFPKTRYSGIVNFTVKYKQKGIHMNLKNKTILLGVTGGIPLFCNLQTDISSQNPFIFRIAGIFLCQVLCIFTLYYIAFHVKQWYNNLRGVIVCTLRRASTKKETRHSFLLYKDTVLMGK